jgi:GNAT superfamily N-acetyltransferase
MRIRPATPDDAESIADVHVASWRAAYSGIVPETILANLSTAERAARWKALTVDPGWHVLVAEDAAAVVGFSSLVPSRDPGANATTIGELTSIYVSPPFWRRGIGRKLLGASLEKARNRGFTRVTLWVLAQNLRARQFYESLGFAPDGTTKVGSELPGVSLHEVRYTTHVRAGAV